MNLHIICIMEKINTNNVYAFAIHPWGLQQTNYYNELEKKRFPITRRTENF